MLSLILEVVLAIVQEIQLYSRVIKIWAALQAALRICLPIKMQGHVLQPVLEDSLDKIRQGIAFSSVNMDQILSLIMLQDIV